MLLRAVPKRLLNTDRHGAPNSSLGSRCQCLTILMVQKFSLMSSVNWTSPTALCHSHAFFPQLPAAETSTFPPQQVAESHEVASWPPILQTGQHKCSQSLLIGPAFQPFYQLCCLPLHTFNYLHILFQLGCPWAHDTQGEATSMLNMVGDSSFDWLPMLCITHHKIQFATATGHTTPAVASLSGRITSVDLLVTLCLVQPTKPLAFLGGRAHGWLMFNLVATRMPSSFSAGLLSSRVAPGMH